MKCCICGKTILDELEENDPWPVDLNPDAVCCDACNTRVVVPARLKATTACDHYCVKHINDLGEESYGGDT